MSIKSWRCRFWVHKYVVLWNEDNQQYRRCRRCGRDDPGGMKAAIASFNDLGGPFGG